MRPNFFIHLHPPTIPAVQARWRYTLGAGGLAVYLVLVLIITGVLETYYYIPTTTGAALSVQTITYFVPFGSLIRNLHFWSAQLLLVVSIVHLTRVIFTAAYLPPRRFNYLLGSFLFSLVVMLDFTGYILRWDTGIQWALVIGTNLIKTIPMIGAPLYQIIIGGTQPGQATLIRFYGWHLFGLMIPAAILVIWHVFRVRRDGGIAVPPPDMRLSHERITRFELARREVLAMLLATAVLILLASLVPAPIAAPLTEIAAPSSEVRAPWFFLWVQQMLKWGEPFLWGVFVPFVILALLAGIPYIFPLPKSSEQGRWFPCSNRFVQVLVSAIGLFILMLTVLAIYLINGI